MQGEFTKKMNKMVKWLYRDIRKCGESQLRKEGEDVKKPPGLRRAALEGIGGTYAGSGMSFFVMLHQSQLLVRRGMQ